MSGAARADETAAGTNSTSAGSEGCGCIDTSATLASLVDRACTTADGNSGVLLDVTGPCVDYTFGSSVCFPHDLNVDRNCITSDDDEGNSSMPEYCYRSWCYVDGMECMATEERVYRSQLFPVDLGENVFYSYSTCGSNAADWFESTHFALGDVSMTAITAAYNIMPWVFKRDYDGNIPAVPGDEYYDNSVPYEGVHINFVNSLQNIADGDFSVNYVHGSKASRKVHPSSPGTAAVQDVADGLVDIAIGPIWITGGRLKMTTFTMPIHHDRTVLVIPKPGSTRSLSAQTQKVLDPFTLGVWGLLLATIAAVALLSTWFRGRGSKIAKKRGSGHFKKKVLARLCVDEFLEKGIFFCSAGVEQEEGDSLPQKLLMFGFAFLILIIVSAYVANLAAFLTRSVPNYVGTIGDSIALGLRICAHPALQSDLELAHPDAKFVFNLEGKELYGLVDDYDAKKCDVMAVGKMDSLGDLKLIDLFCERELVYTDSTVIENPVGFPIRSDLASGFSYWMYQAEKYHGISVESSEEAFNTEYKREPSCNVLLSEQNEEPSDYAQISVENLVFPVMFFLGFAVVAILIQLYHEWLMKKASREGLRGASLVGRASTLNLFAGTTKSMRHINRKAHNKYDDKYDEDSDEEVVCEVPTPQFGPVGLDSRMSRREEARNSSSIATGVVTSDSVRLDSFRENNETERSDRKKVSFASFDTGSQDDVHSNGVEDTAPSGLDSGVLDKLDEFIESYQSMKRRKKLRGKR